MDDAALFSELRQVFEKLGVEVREQYLSSEMGRAGSGLVRIRSRKIFYLDQTLELPEKINIMVETLRGFDLEGIFLPPYIRALVEEQDGEKR
jgi:hypothetical protein